MCGKNKIMYYKQKLSELKKYKILKKKHVKQLINFKEI